MRYLQDPLVIFFCCYVLIRLFKHSLKLYATKEAVRDEALIVKNRRTEQLINAYAEGVHDGHELSVSGAYQTTDVQRMAVRWVADQSRMNLIDLEN